MGDPDLRRCSSTPAHHAPEYFVDLEELAGAVRDERDRRRFLGDNARELFAITC